MNKKAISLGCMGTGAAAVTAATAAYALSSGEGEDIKATVSEQQPEQIEQPQPQETTSDNTTETPPVQDAAGAQPEKEAVDTAEVKNEEAAASTPPPTKTLSSGLNSNTTDNANKGTYFGKGMAFGEASFNPTSSNTGLSKKADGYFGDFGKDYAKGDYDKIRSNLKITVTKYTCDQNKWGGEMTGFGSFENKKTNKGFITYNKATANKERNGLVLTGIFYLMEKEKENNQGKVTSQKEITETDNKVMTKSNFGQYFPKPYGYTQAGKFDKLYYTNGDFIDDANKLDSICDAPTTTTSSITKSGEWEYRSSQWWETHGGGWGFEWYNHVYDGAGDQSNTSGVQWFNYMYGQDTFQLEDQLGSFYVGTWYVKKPWSTTSTASK